MLERKAEQRIKSKRESQEISKAGIVDESPEDINQKMYFVSERNRG